MKSERLMWFKKEIAKHLYDLDDETSSIVHSRVKMMKLHKLLNSEIDYKTSDYTIFRNDYHCLRIDIEEYIKELVQKEVDRRLYQKELIAIERRRADGTSRSRK